MESRQDGCLLIHHGEGSSARFGRGQTRWWETSPIEPVDQVASDVARLRAVTIGDRGVHSGKSSIGVHGFFPVHPSRGGAGASLSTCLGLLNSSRPSSSSSARTPLETGTTGLDRPATECGG